MIIIIILLIIIIGLLICICSYLSIIQPYVKGIFRNTLPTYIKGETNEPL